MTRKLRYGEQVSLNFHNVPRFSHPTTGLKKKKNLKLLCLHFQACNAERCQYRLSDQETKQNMCKREGMECEGKKNPGENSKGKGGQDLLVEPEMSNTCRRPVFPFYPKLNCG